MRSPFLHKTIQGGDRTANLVTLSKVGDRISSAKLFKKADHAAKMVMRSHFLHKTI
jgi:hypothetical protein